MAFYLQNVNAADFSLVSSGRDIIPYSASTVLRLAASRKGNILNFNALPLAGTFRSLARELWRFLPGVIWIWVPG